MNKNDVLKSTYCNPLPIPSIPVGRGAYAPGFTGHWWREFGDPTVIKFKDRWYLFPSCGMVWHSDNLRDWTFQSINLFDIGWAPSVIEKNGILYLTASWEGSNIWRTSDPLGHWECIGQVRDYQGNEIRWADPMLFVDEDSSMYCYYSIEQNRGIFGVRLRDDDPTRFADAPINFFAFDPNHIWERFGECCQNSKISHLEGAFMTKHDGRYYLQYSAAGAEWRNYAVGCYVGDTPLGTFHYQKRNPILIQRGGLINGCGHHSIVEGPDHNLWCFYTILMRRFCALERRIAMDPVRFDEYGEMYVDGPSETPRFLDGTYPESVVQLSICQSAEASGFSPGHEPEYAVDNYMRTWWQADTAICPQQLTVDLSEQYEVMAARIIFNEQLVPHAVGKAVFQYRIECSDDGYEWFELCDRTISDFDGHIRYETWTGKHARQIRLVITAVPAGSTPGVIDFCVFGHI